MATSSLLSRKIPAIALFAAGLCAWCGWASGFHHSSTPALATWSGSLAGVVLIDLWLGNQRRGWRPALTLRPASNRWPRPGSGVAYRTFLGISPWMAIFIVTIAWEALGIDTGPHQPHLTISALAQAYRPMNAALMLVWILVGIGYGAARSRQPVVTSDGNGRDDGTPHVGSPASLGMLMVGQVGFSPALLLPNSRAVGVGFWVGFVIACVMVDLVARRSRGRLANAEELVRLVSRPPLANIVLIAGWTFAGWHLFAH